MSVRPYADGKSKTQQKYLKKNQWYPLKFCGKFDLNFKEW